MTLLERIPADRFTMQQLADLYNQTRVDYLIPMPMNANRLAEYVHDFDVSLAHSLVIREKDGPYLGLCMLGLRPAQGWITRLGVLPASRRRGMGTVMMDELLETVERMGLPSTLLEVIKNNTPAHQLFLAKNFQLTTEYLVLRRAPYSATLPLQGCTYWLDRNGALDALDAYPHHLTWINAIPSMRNSSNLQGLRLELADGSKGWLVFRYYRFALTHLVIHTEQGDPDIVGRQLLMHLHARHPRQDSLAENIDMADPHLHAFSMLGYFENFRRLEMIRKS